MPTQAPLTRCIFVRKLALPPFAGRNYAVRRPLAWISTILLTALLPQGANARGETPQWQPVEQISATAETFLRSRTGTFAGNTTVEAGNLDSRHRLTYCDEPLQAFLRRGTQIKARTIVGVRCNGTKQWKVYVPVDVVVTASVLVARQTLVKGQLLTAADLISEPRDVTRLRSGYLSDLQQVVGQRLKTQLIAGKTLTPSMIAADLAIRRGQSVTLTVGAGDFNITMAGTALVGGALNQRIRVKNSHSGRIVEGVVRSREHVEVLLSSDNHFFHAEPKVSPKSADTGFSNNDR